MDRFGTFDSCSGHFLTVQVNMALDPEIYLIEFEINELSSGEMFSKSMLFTISFTRTEKNRLFI